MISGQEAGFLMGRQRILYAPAPTRASSCRIIRYIGTTVVVRDQPASAATTPAFSQNQREDFIHPEFPLFLWELWMAGDSEGLEGEWSFEEFLQFDAVRLLMHQAGVTRGELAAWWSDLGEFTGSRGGCFDLSPLFRLWQELRSCAGVPFMADSTSPGQVGSLPNNISTHAANCKGPETIGAAPGVHVHQSHAQCFAGGCLSNKANDGQDRATDLGQETENLSLHTPATKPTCRLSEVSTEPVSTVSSERTSSNDGADMEQDQAADTMNCTMIKDLGPLFDSLDRDVEDTVTAKDASHEPPVPPERLPEGSEAPKVPDRVFAPVSGRIVRYIGTTVTVRCRGSTTRFYQPALCSD